MYIKPSLNISGMIMIIYDDHGPWLTSFYGEVSPSLGPSLPGSLVLGHRPGGLDWFDRLTLWFFNMAMENHHF